MVTNYLFQNHYTYLTTFPFVPTNLCYELGAQILRKNYQDYICTKETSIRGILIRLYRINPHFQPYFYQLHAKLTLKLQIEQVYNYQSNSQFNQQFQFKIFLRVTYSWISQSNNRNNINNVKIIILFYVNYYQTKNLENFESKKNTTRNKLITIKQFKIISIKILYYLLIIQQQQLIQFLKMTLTNEILLNWVKWNYRKN
eukprot:TRINITY_DN6109_c1_g1_i5.p1 TRINITY_DN6109_c1_g1~~TRINITY_DN6109_c1_g1_i5.p1  ORF type:complete len:210 (-),score=-11.16 TRINITY_DN6109_c1_g1_i5:227-826(-)